MQTYRIQAWDLNTNVLLTELTASDVTYSERMNDAGEFSFNLPLADPQSAALTNVIQGLDGNPFKVLITANENTKILFAGIGWHQEMQASDEFLAVSGKALPSYFAQVVAAASYTASIQPTKLLQSAIVDLQAQPGYNLGIGTRFQVSSQPPNIKPAYALSQHVTVAQIVADITAAITPGTGGVDYTMEHAFINGVPRHTIVIAAPRCGRDQTVSKLTLNVESATDWTYVTDNTSGGNHAIVIGSGSGVVQPKGEARVTTPVGGYGQPPAMDIVLQYNQVSGASQLQNIANGAIQMYGKPVTVFTITMPADYEPMPLGSFGLGDDVRVRAAPSIHFPRGKDEWWRIVAVTVNITGDGVPTYELTLNRPPVF